MSKIISVPLAALASVAPFMANKDIRYYLCGVQVEVKDGYTLCVATDGHTLAFAKHSIGDNDDQSGETLLLRREDVLFILKNIATTDSLEVEILEGYAIAIRFGGTEIKTMRIDGKYPDWRQASAYGLNGSGIVCVNPEFVARIAKSHKAARKFGAMRGYALGVNLETRGGATPIHASCVDEAESLSIGYVLMPLRDGTPLVNGVLGSILDELKPVSQSED